MRIACLGILLASAAAAQSEYTLIDVQKAPLTGDPSSALVRVSVPGRVEEVSCDALVAGAGMGGIAAGLALAGRGHSVCLTEETDWVGGQATAGGVSGSRRESLHRIRRRHAQLYAVPLGDPRLVPPETAR